MLNELIKEAMKSKDKIALNTYKNIKTELQKVLTSKNAPEYSDDLVIKVSKKYADNLEKAIKQFSEAGREDLVSEYTSELEVVKKLLPEPVDESQIRSYITSLDFSEKLYPENFDKIQELKELGIVVLDISFSKKDMGKAIKILKSQFPTADGKMISDIVKFYING